MTEEEAKDKICPIIQGNCIGSECMFWKWGWTDEGLEQDPRRPYKFLMKGHYSDVEGSCGLIGGMK